MGLRRLIVAPLLIALWLLLPTRAEAQINQCVDFSSSWTTPYYQPPGPVIQSISYILPTQLLIGFYTSGDILIVAGVPTGTAQQFTTLGNADAKWNTVVRQYPRVLSAQNGCPLLAQSGHYLLANP